MDDGLNNLAAAANYMHEFNTDGATSQQGIDRISNQLVLHRLRYEYFYSTMDFEYFKDNEFLPIVQQLGYDIMNPILRSTLTEIRHAMARKIGTPRRFSLAFIQKERKRLWDTRKRIRLATFESASSFSEMRNSLTIRSGDFVIVYSQVNKVLCRGRVISEGPFYSESRGYLIGFDNPLFRNEWCYDFDIKKVERGTGGSSSSSSLPINISHVRESIQEFVDHAKTAVVNVIDLRNGSTEYSPLVLDTIVRCVALILWMKRSINISSARHEDIEALSQQAMNYVTDDLENISSEDKEAICRELQGAIRQVFSLSVNNDSPRDAL